MPRDRKHILYVQPNSEVGGSDICLLRLVRALDRDRYRATVLLPRPGPLVPMFQAAGARVAYEPMRQLRTLPSLTYQGGFLCKFLPTVCRIARWIIDENVDLVHTNSLYSLYGAWAAKLARRPHVWHVREIPPAIALARPAYLAMVKRLSNLILPMSRACAEPFGDSPRVHTLHDGIDLAEFGANVNGARVREELGIAPDTPVVGFVGRLDPWKGLDVFLNAARQIVRRVPDVCFVVAGGAPQGFEHHERDMRALAARLGLNSCVKFIGFRYGPAEIPQLMSALSVFCHTSVEPEPFGLVLLEAMAMARPVIAARAGGPMDIVVEGETGYLTQPRDAAGLADAAVRVLSDPARAAALGAAGRKRVETRFSSQQFAQGLSDIYRSVFQRQPERAPASASFTHSIERLNVAGGPS